MLLVSSTKEKFTTTMKPLLVCRIKPTNLPTEEQCVKVTSDTIVQLDIPESFHQEYTFKRIFTEKSTQKEVFDEVALPLVNQLVNGRNGLLFTYGVTGSGKTYTMTGNRKEAGVMQRCFDVLFNSIQDLQAQRFVFKPDKVNGFVVQDEEAAKREREEWSRINTNKLRKRESQEDLLSARSKDSTKIIIRKEDNAYAVFITYIKVYNNYVYDLLDHLVDANIYSRPQPKLVREDSSGNMYMHGIAEIEVKSAEEAFEILRKGQRRKRMAHTVLNADSSRSHSIFTIRLVQAPLVSNGETVTRDTSKFCVNQLSLVDLAGSERTSRTKNTGQRLCEAGKINQSLMVLRKCLESLRENQINGTNCMVPYREQKITMLFKNFFEGDGDIRMILCINPSMSDAEENLLVLQFAEVSQDITTKSTSLKIGSGLTSERRNGNETPNESMEKLNEAEATQEENTDPVERRSINRKVYHEFGEFPNIEDYSDEEDFRRNLINHLEERILHIEIFKTDIANKTSKFKALLAGYAKDNTIDMKRKRDPLSVKIENELSKTNIAGKISPRRQELTKPRKIARKTSLETKDNALPSGEKAVEGFSITLEKIDRHQAGVYQCTASNGVGDPVTVDMQLDVLYPPEIDVERNWIHSGEGFEAQLVCIVHGEPLSEVLWYQDSFLLDPTDRRTMDTRGNKHTLTIRNAQSADFGNYSCQAENSLGKARKYMELSGRPTPAEFENKAHARFRDSYNLTWSIESYPPLDEVRLLYRKVTMNETHQQPGQWHDIMLHPSCPKTEKNDPKCEMWHLIRGLESGSSYEAIVQAKNKYGWNEVSDLYQFYTRGHADYDNMVEPDMKDLELVASDSSSAVKISTGLCWMIVFRLWLGNA